MTMERISQREYARRKSWNSGYVNKLVKRGVIVLVDGQVDPAQADQAIAAAKDPAKAYMQGVNQRQRAQARGTLAPTAAELGTADLDPAGASSFATYHRAKTAREVYEAKLSQMEYEERAGKLLRADAVRKAFATQVSAARDALLQIPARLAPILAAEADAGKVASLLEQELRQALANLSAGAVAVAS